MNNEYLIKDVDSFKCKENIIIFDEVIEFFEAIKKIIFINYYYRCFNKYTVNKLVRIAKRNYIKFAKIDENCKVLENFNEFLKEIPAIRKSLIDDANAIFEGDPAAVSTYEIILSYPGFMAITAYRIASYFYEHGLKISSRIISEYAHSKTGIDIHPGAKIGKSFFIDHGTGIVIGETTIIGDNVKLYQGVTLGALSLKEGRNLKNVKRHPTIEDNVTIYSGASIFGGDTVIGKNSVIGSNVFITKSVPANSKVVIKSCDIEIK